MPQQYLFPKRVLKTFPGLQKTIWRLEYWLFAAVFGLLALLPPATAGGLAAGLFRLFGPVSGKAIKVRRNLRIAFPDMDETALRRRMRDTFAHLGRAMAELAQAPRVWGQQASRFEFEAVAGARELLRPGCPAVLVTAHVSAWQYTPFVGPHYGIELTNLYAPESNPFMQQLFLKLRNGLGGRWSSRDNAMRKLIKELAAGNCVGLVTDIRADGGEMLPLLGHDAETNTVPARLAMRFDCPVITVRAERLPGTRYRISLTRVIRPDADLADDAARVRQMSLELNREFERWIEASPGQWACMNRRWPKPLDRSMS